ncbi:flagellar filament capping protein FliD [Paenibacillus glucanolyticus]
MGISITGMASGMDIDNIISKLMKAERVPADKLAKEKQSLIWKRDEYRNINTILSKFNNAVNELRFSSAFNKMSVNSSNNSVVEASLKGNPLAGSYSVQVNSLATSPTVIGTALPADTDVNKSRFTTGTFTISNGSGTSVDITVDANSSLTTIINDINKSGTSIRASYDPLNKKISLTSSQLGQSSNIELGGNTNVLASLGLSQTTATGQDASVVVNGKSMTISNNSFELDGILFNLKGVSSDTSLISVSKDNSAVKQKIIDFVNLYNSTIDELRAKSNEEVFRDYKPLTKEEEEVMSEKQIDLWNTKARSGLLRNNQLIEDTINSLRGVVNQRLTIDGEFKSLAHIGISPKTFTDGGVSELGKLKIDENKLEQALNNNPDDVIKLFTQSPSTGSTDPKKETGIAENLYQTLQTQMKKVIKQIGSSTNSEVVDESILGKQLKEYNSKMSDIERRLAMIETRYTKQFTAMEQAIQRLNTQGSWLSQQLGS